MCVWLCVIADINAFAIQLVALNIINNKHVVIPIVYSK